MRCPRCKRYIEDGHDACPFCGALFRPEPCATHPDRMAQTQCVICGRALCDECDDRRGAVSRCDEHATIPMVEGWAEVYQTGDEIEAHLMEENLRAQDIEARVFSQKDHAFNLSVGEMARVRVLVPARDYLDALDIIRSHTAQD